MLVIHLEITMIINNSHNLLRRWLIKKILLCLTFFLLTKRKKWWKSLDKMWFKNKNMVIDPVLEELWKEQHERIRRFDIYLMTN
jgi:hypothetical protein